MTPVHLAPSDSPEDGNDPASRRRVPRLGRPMGEAMRTVGPVMSVGFAFVFALGIGYGIGLTLDRWFGTTPWLTLIFSLIGLAAGVLTVYRVVREAMRG